MKTPVNTSTATYHARPYSQQERESAFGNGNDTLDADAPTPAGNMIDAVFTDRKVLRKYPFINLEREEPLGLGTQNTVFKARLGPISAEGTKEQYRRLRLSDILESNGYTGINHEDAKKTAEKEAETRSIDGQLGFIDSFYKRRGGENPFRNREAVVLVSNEEMVESNKMGKWLERSADLFVGYFNPAMVHSAWTDIVNGRLITVSEYVPHISPEEFRESATVRHCVRAMLRSAVALSDFNAKGFIHRDIKPENILMGKGDIKIADFGIAKVAKGQDIMGGMTLTCTGQAMGTPLYMSPEAARNAVDVDHKTDMFSLGATLYNLLTNRAFNPPKPRKDSRPGEIVVSDIVNNAVHWDVRPKRLTDIGPRRIFKEKGGWLFRKKSKKEARKQDLIIRRLEDAICAATQYHPFERYEGWQQFIEDLANFDNPDWKPWSDVVKRHVNIDRRREWGKQAFYRPLTSMDRS